MVVVLLMLLFLSLLQVCLHLYTRNLLTAAAANTARQAATSGTDAYPVTALVAAEIDGALTGGTLESLRCTVLASGLQVGLTCTMESPGLLGFLDDVMPTITVTGHSVREDPP